MNVSVSAASEATLSFNDAQLLLDASKYNDCERLQDVIWNGINVDAQDHSGWTALMEAAVRGHADAMSLLISKNADINLRDKQGTNALITAAKSEKGDACLALLIHHGAQLNAQDEWGCTALHGAVDLGNVNAITRLVDAGINVNIQDQRGFTALHTACRRTDITTRDRIIPLMRGGADMHIRNKRGELCTELPTSRNQSSWSNDALRQLLSNLEAERSRVATSTSATTSTTTSGDGVKESPRVGHAVSCGGVSGVPLPSGDETNTFTTTISTTPPKFLAAKQSSHSLGEKKQQQWQENIQQQKDVQKQDKDEQRGCGPLEGKLLDLQAALDQQLVSAEEFQACRARLLEKFLVLDLVAGRVNGHGCV